MLNRRGFLSALAAICVKPKPKPIDAAFLESRCFHVDEICRVFRVPPRMVATSAVVPAQFPFYATALQNGWVTHNEAREPEACNQFQERTHAA